ncbi:hypothetical protein [Pedomonas sp. V897]|mgnify:CR=1 FL=1|uniref:hypothetical protein n=1 Tax=Pedomonas sp. V897 TaxID=3446482 RepID=UPI003EE3C069
MLKRLLPLGLLVPSVALAGEPVSFQRDIVPVLRTRCATCHMTGREAGNIALHPGAAYASLVNVSSVSSKHLRVKPGAPEDSYLMMKLDGTHLDAGGKGARMPMGAPPLDEKTREKIRNWIAEGAQDN